MFSGEEGIILSYIPSASEVTAKTHVRKEIRKLPFKMTESVLVNRRMHK